MFRLQRSELEKLLSKILLSHPHSFFVFLLDEKEFMGKKIRKSNRKESKKDDR